MLHTYRIISYSLHKISSWTTIVFGGLIVTGHNKAKTGHSTPIHHDVSLTGTVNTILRNYFGEKSIKLEGFFAEEDICSWIEGLCWLANSSYKKKIGMIIGGQHKTTFSKHKYGAAV